MSDVDKIIGSLEAPEDIFDVSSQKKFVDAITNINSVDSAEFVEKTIASFEDHDLPNFTYLGPDVLKLYLDKFNEYLTSKNILLNPKNYGFLNIYMDNLMFDDFLQIKRLQLQAYLNKYASC